MEETIEFCSPEVFKEKLLTMANALGQPVPSRSQYQIVERLCPMSSKEGKKDTLSQQFGFEKFPLHTDGAHWVTPPRYVLLASMQYSSQNCQTLLLHHLDINLSSSQQRAMQEGLFIVSNGKHSFFCEMYDRTRTYIRFDPGCMRPQNDEGHMALKILSIVDNSEKSKKIKWFPGKIIVIDNWRVLHGRDRVPEEECNREIWRVLIQ